MEGAQRETGGGIGDARPFIKRQREPDRSASSFKVSADGTRFSFAPWWKTPKDPSLLSKYTSSLKLIGGYSEDEDKNFCNDKTSMNFMNMEYYPFDSSRELKVDLNLDVGDNLKRYTLSTKRDLENFLSWILSNEDVFTQQLILDKESEGKGGKFVLMRNALAEICNTYLNRQETSFFATCFDGVIYILQNEEKTFYFTGSRIFEHQISHNQGTDKKRINHANHRIVTSTCLGEHRIILSSLSHCFNLDKYKEPVQDTSAMIILALCYNNPTNDKTKKIERYKMFCWCLRLCLSGIPELLIGYLNCQGIVDILKMYDKSDLINNGKVLTFQNCLLAVLNLIELTGNTCSLLPGHLTNTLDLGYSRDHKKTDSLDGTSTPLMNESGIL